MIRELRERAALSQVELARLAGVQPRTVSDIENRKRRPRPSTRRRLARALGLRPEEIDW